MTPDRVYAAITADVIGYTEQFTSQGQPIRPKLLELLGALNRKCGDHLAVPFSTTLADEFQGLVDPPCAGPLVVGTVRLVLAPLSCRIGIGTSSVVSSPASSTREMEGRAFQLSREALISSKSKGPLTVYRADNRVAEFASNATSILIDAIQARWTPKQWEAVRLYDELADMSKVGEALAISAPAVQHRLNGAQWRSLKEANEKLYRLLDALYSCGTPDS